MKIIIGLNIEASLLSRYLVWISKGREGNFYTVVEQVLLERG
jgi:hypothetical protein